MMTEICLDGLVFGLPFPFGFHSPIHRLFWYDFQCSASRVAALSASEQISQLQLLLGYLHE